LAFRLKTVFLCGWLVSFTVTYDVIDQIKLMDIFFFFGLILFRNEIYHAWRYRGKAAQLIFLLMAIAFVGAMITAFYRLAEGVDLALPVLFIRLYRFWGYLLIFLIIRYLPIGRKELSLLLCFAFFLLTAQAIIINLQMLGFVPILWPEREMLYGKVLTGTLYLNHSNTVLFMTIGICIAISYMSSIPRAHIIVILSIVTLFMLSAMIIGQARSTFISLGVFLFIFLLGKKVRSFSVVAACIVLLLVLGQVIGIDVWSDTQQLWHGRVMRAAKVENISDVRTIVDLDVHRPSIWNSAMVGLLEMPHAIVIGVGFTNYKNLRARKTGHASNGHNFYIHTLVELGLIGLLTFLLLFRAIWKEMGTVGAKNKKHYHLLTVGGKASLLGVMALGFVNCGMYPYVSLIGFLGFSLSYFAIVTHRGWLVESNPMTTWGTNR